jgi:hypothetical protein
MKRKKIFIDYKAMRLNNLLRYLNNNTFILLLISIISLFFYFYSKLVLTISAVLLAILLLYFLFLILNYCIKKIKEFVLRYYVHWNEDRFYLSLFCLSVTFYTFFDDLLVKYSLYALIFSICLFLTWVINSFPTLKLFIKAHIADILLTVSALLMILTTIYFVIQIYTYMKDLWDIIPAQPFDGIKSDDSYTTEEPTIIEEDEPEWESSGESSSESKPANEPHEGWDDTAIIWVGGAMLCICAIIVIGFLVEKYSN